MSEYLVFFTDGNLVPIGQFVDEWTDIELVLRFNDVDSGVITLPADPAVAALAVAPNRVVVMRDSGPGGSWEIVIAGPIEHPDDFDWGLDNPDTFEPGQAAIYFADDRAAVAERLVYPDPTHDATHQTAAVSYVASAVNAEVAMLDFVNKNAGPGALAARRVPQLSIAGPAGVGTTISYSARMEPLGDSLRAMALAGGGLGYRVVQVAGPTRRFEVFAPVNRSGTVRYSRALGNLTNLSYRSQAPTATVAIVGGDGTGTSRTFVEVVDSGAVAVWGRKEVFVNEDSADPTELAQAGAAALVDAGEQVQLSATAIDEPGTGFGIDYNLGDTVSVEVREGLVVTDVVTAVSIKVTSAGEVISPTIGTGGATSDGKTLKELRRLQAKLGKVERT